MGPRNHVRTGEPIKYARVSAFNLQPEHLPAAIQMFHKTTAPIVLPQPGFLALVGLANHVTGHALVISIWETDADRDASAASADFARNLGQYSSIFSGPMIRDTYDATFLTLPPPGPDGQSRAGYARVTSAQIQPEMWEEATARLRDLGEREFGELAGFMGTIVLENRGTSRTLLVELWETRAALGASENSVFYLDRIARRSGYVSETPSHEVMEVAGQY
jgi:heme-degrading monooxygenase HmoA